MLLLCLFLMAHLIESVPILPKEAVRWYLKPSDPRAPIVMSLVDRFAKLTHPKTIMSAGIASQPLDRILQYYVSQLDSKEATMLTGTLTSGTKYDNIIYSDRDTAEVLLGYRGNIDLFYLPNSPKAPLLLIEAIKKVTKRGMIVVDGCAADGCKSLVKFADETGWMNTGPTGEGLITLTRKDEVSQASEQPSNVFITEDRVQQQLNEGNPHAVFYNIYSSTCKRYHSMFKLAKLAQQRSSRVILESGTMNSSGFDCDQEGCSTVLLGRLAKLTKGRLYTVDSDKEALNRSRTSDSVGVLRDNVEFVHSDPLKYLEGFSEHIDVLFLKYDASGPQKLLGLVKAAERKLHSRSIVVLDGCEDAGVEKCKPATDHLIADGWALAHNTFQRVLVKISDQNPRIPSLPNKPVVVIGNIATTSIVNVPEALAQGNREAIFSGLINPHFRRYVSFEKVVDLAIRRKAKMLVETGTSRAGTTNCRGDGCSTSLLGRLAQLLGGHLHTVDISADNIASSRGSNADLHRYVSYHVSDSVAFLEKFPDKIDVLYLDSYDYDGIEFGPSQQHHLKELVAAWDKLHQDTVIFLDDCALAYEGKCKMASAYLSDHGWKLIVDNYQRVYIREGSQE